jgi:SWI/SNF-related matrix-associated actin-dependent regulator of chromatin subfamily A3
MCRTALPSPDTSLVKPGEDKTSADEQLSMADMEESSSKVDALLQILEGTPHESQVKVATRLKDAGVKTIVFSQFTKFLDVIGTHLVKHGFSFVRVDGSMSLAKRELALRMFKDSPEHTILLASLAVCSTGVLSLRMHPNIVKSRNGKPGHFIRQLVGALD